MCGFFAINSQYNRLITSAGLGMCSAISVAYDLEYKKAKIVMFRTSFHPYCISEKCLHLSRTAIAIICSVEAI